MYRHRLTQTIDPLPWIQVILLTALILFPLAAGAQGPPFPFPGSTRGQEAIEALGDRLPEVAMRYGKSAERLQELFQQNSDLWLDPEDSLVYLCSFDLEESLEAPEGTGTASATMPYNQTFLLHSRPGASKVIYLDFDGHTTSGTSWNSSYNGGADIISQPFSTDSNSSNFSNDELARIQEIWTRVAEDLVGLLESLARHAPHQVFDRHEDVVQG